MNPAVTATLRESVTESANELIKLISSAGNGYTPANLLAVAEIIDQSDDNMRDVLIAAFSMRLCKLGPVVKIHWLNALTTVALRKRP